MLPPNDPKAGAAGPDADDLDAIAAGWDPYVTSLLSRAQGTPTTGDADDAVPVMSLARVEDRRRR